MKYLINYDSDTLYVCEDETVRLSKETERGYKHFIVNVDDLFDMLEGTFCAIRD